MEHKNLTPKQIRNRIKCGFGIGFKFGHKYVEYDYIEICWNNTCVVRGGQQHGRRFNFDALCHENIWNLVRRPDETQ